MNKQKSQTGSIHLLIVLIVVIALLGALGFVYWNNFTNDTTSSTTYLFDKMPDHGNVLASYGSSKDSIKSTTSIVRLDNNAKTSLDTGGASFEEYHGPWVIGGTFTIIKNADNGYSILYPDGSTKQVANSLDSTLSKNTIDGVGNGIAIGQDTLLATKGYALVQINLTSGSIKNVFEMNVYGPTGQAGAQMSLISITSDKKEAFVYVDTYQSGKVTIGNEVIAGNYIFEVNLSDGTYTKSTMSNNIGGIHIYSISNDGKHIAYVNYGYDTDNTEHDYVLDKTTGESTELPSGSFGTNGYAYFSPDDKFLILSPIGVDNSRYLQVWSFASESIITEVKTQNSIIGIGWSDNNDYIYKETTADDNGVDYFKNLNISKNETSDIYQQSKSYYYWSTLISY